MMLMHGKDRLQRNDQKQYKEEMSHLAHGRLLQLFGHITKLKGTNQNSEMRSKLLNGIMLLLQNEIQGDRSFLDKLREEQDSSDDENNLIDTTEKGMKKAKKIEDKSQQEDRLVSVLTLIGAIRILN